MKIVNLNNNNIYIANVSSYFKNLKQAIFLFYSPLSETTFLCDKNNILQLEEGILKYKNEESIDTEIDEILASVLNEQKATSPKIQQPSDYSKLSIIPTSNCNLKCSYCYSAEGRATTTIDKAGIETTLDFFFRKNTHNKKALSIFITGGGEPLLAWDVVNYTLKRSAELASVYNKNLTVMLMTNGTVITPEIIESFKRHRVELGISFDIFEKIQNSQRGKYDVVKNNIFQFLDQGITPSISTVITKNNVQRQSEMVSEVASVFKGIKHLNFDPAMDDFAFTTTNELDVFYDLFITNFIEARKTAHQLGMTLDCNIIRKVQSINQRYCEGKLCLTPESTISMCHTISSPKEEHYQHGIYGSVEKENITFDEEKFKSLVNTDANSYNECKTCIAKWHCGGGCLMYRLNYNQEKMESVCKFTRKLVTEILMAKLDAQYQSEMNMSVYEFLEKEFQ